MVVGQSSATDADVLALSKPLEPEVLEAQMPHLPTVIDESGFTRVGVNLEYLHHFDLEIEVKTFATFRRAVFLRDLRQVGNVLRGEHPALSEVCSSPLT